MTRLHPDFLSIPLAHRGLHDITDGRPENSIEGINAAIAAGYGVEIDLQRSLDGQAMVFHDYSLQRLTGKTGAVAQHTIAELSEITLNHGRAPIPSFAEILELVNGRVPLLVEMKDQDGAFGPDTKGWELGICDALRNYSGPVALMSFNPHSVARCADHAPNIARGLVTEVFTKEKWPLIPDIRRQQLDPIPDYDRVGASFISHNCKDFPSDRVDELRQKDADVLCWVTRSPQEEVAARIYAQNITFEDYLP